MQRIAILLLFVLVTGCSSGKSLDELQERGGVYYPVNDPNPYSGKVNGETSGHYGRVKYEFTTVDGKKHGMETYWFKSSGKKYHETHWKNGKKDGLETQWWPNGQKAIESNWKNGKRVGQMSTWSKDGVKLN